MKMSLHYRISVVKLIVSMLFLISATATLTAQEITHSGHWAKVPARIADIVRDLSDIPPSIGHERSGYRQAVTVTGRSALAPRELLVRVGRSLHLKDEKGRKHK